MFGEMSFQPASLYLAEQVRGKGTSCSSHGNYLTEDILKVESSIQERHKLVPKCNDS